jgi:hypothetical protein
VMMGKVSIFACFAVWITVVRNGRVYTGSAPVCPLDIRNILCSLKYVNRVAKMGLDVMVFGPFKCFFTDIYVNFPIILRYFFHF